MAFTSRDGLISLLSISRRHRNRLRARSVLTYGDRREQRGATRFASEEEMRFAGNFNPEWGYLAPAPSFVRTTRTVLVAAAVGATAGAAVVFSLVDRPVAEESVAARTLARPAITAAAPLVERSQTAARQVAAQEGLARSTPSLMDPKPTVQAQPMTPTPVAAAVTGPSSESGPSATLQRPAGIAALAEAPAANETMPPRADALTRPTAPAPKKVARKHRIAPRSEPAYGGPGGPFALLRPLNGRGGNGGFWSRDDYSRDEN